MDKVQSENPFDYFYHQFKFFENCIQNLTMINRFYIDKYLIFHQNILNFLFYLKMNAQNFFVKKEKLIAIKISFLFI